MPDATAKAPSQTASFVTGLAWSFIGLSGIGLLLAVIQYVLFASELPMEELRTALLDAVKLKLLPPLIMTVFDHLRGIAIGQFAASLLLLLVSISLLKRHNWARLAFAWIMILVAVVHIAGALLPFYLLHDFSPPADTLPPELLGVVTTVKNLFTGFSAVMGLAFAGFFAWIAKRLVSADIKQEFTAAA
jgi:hypothetical protein